MLIKASENQFIFRWKAKSWSVGVLAHWIFLHDPNTPIRHHSKVARIGQSIILIQL